MTEPPGVAEPRGDPEREDRSTAAFVGVLTAALVVLSGLVALGTWQVRRLSWKLDLIARVEQRVHGEPTAPPDRSRWSGVGAASDEYRHVQVRGTFQNEAETLVQAATDLGAGFWVMTPLRTATGDTILVNRGFVPSERRDPSTRIAGDIKGDTVVVGLLRVTEPRGGFLRSNDPDANRWYSRDVAAIAAARHLAGAAPFFIDADATPNSGGYPVGGLTVVSFPNNHLVYAATWYGLAALLLAAMVWFVRDRRRSRDIADHDGSRMSRAPS